MVKKYTPEDLNKLLELDKLDELHYATNEMNPHQIRSTLAKGLDSHIAENYDLGIDKALKEAEKQNQRPLLQRALKGEYADAPELDLNKIYENKLEKPTRLKLYEGPSTERGFTDVSKLDEPLIQMNKAGLDKGNTRGIILHEDDHIRDMIKNKFNSKDDDLVQSLLKSGKGLENAEKVFGNHHGRGFFELEALKKLTKNKLLGAIPVLGAGLTANEIFKSGNVFAADPTGLTSSENVGEGSDELPNVTERDIYNAKMKRTKQLLK